MRSKREPSKRAKKREAEMDRDSLLFRLCKVCQREIPAEREGNTCSDICAEILHR
jgi:hypothetical protein